MRDGNGQRTVIYQAPEDLGDMPDPCAPDSEGPPDSEGGGQRTEFYQAPEECADLPDPAAPSEPPAALSSVQGAALYGTQEIPPDPPRLPPPPEPPPPPPPLAALVPRPPPPKGYGRPPEPSYPSIDVDDDDFNPRTVPMHPVAARALIREELSPLSSTDRVVVRIDESEDEARTVLFEAADSDPGLPDPAPPEPYPGFSTSDRTEHLDSDDLLERLMEGVASERPPPPAPMAPAPPPQWAPSTQPIAAQPMVSQPMAPQPTGQATGQPTGQPMRTPQQNNADATVARPSLYFAPEGPGARELSRVRWVFIAAVVLVTLLALVGVILVRGRGA